MTPKQKFTAAAEAAALAIYKYEVAVKAVDTILERRAKSLLNLAKIPRKACQRPINVSFPPKKEW